MVLFSIALLWVGVAAVQGQSALDGFDPNADEQVFAIVVQPDGKILVGGRFRNISGEKHNRLVRLNPDGTLDADFKHPDVDGERGGTVYAMAVQADGKILLGGDFTTVNGVTRNFIARLNSDGTVDTTFVELNQRFTDVVLSIAVQADGKILVGGRVGNNWFIRLNRDGTEDSTFNPNVYYDVRAIALQADGKILIGGDFTKIGGEPRNYIARLHPDGKLDTDFKPQASNKVFSIAVQVDGKVLAGGFFTAIGGAPRNYIARLNATTGLVDSSDPFNPNPNSDVRSIVVQSDGKILVGGDFITSIGQAARHCIARVNPDGTPDSFDPNAANVSNLPRVLAIAVQTDGKVLVGGDFTTLAPNGGLPVTRNYIARLGTDGSLDQTLNFGIVGNSVLATAVQPDGKILIGGSFSRVLDVERKNIARLNADGTLDLEFDPKANGPVEAIAVADSVGTPVAERGTILVGGDFTSIGGEQRNRIARLFASGPKTGKADSFNPNAQQSVRCIAVEAEGTILVGGRFNGSNSIGGKNRNYIARLKPDGTVDELFNPNANGVVNSIAIQPDSAGVPMADRGKILVGGTFTTLQPNDATSTTTRHYIARLKPGGTLDPDFNPNANDAVFSIAVQADDGKILAGGLFSGLNSIGGMSGETRNYIARLNSDGTLDNASPFNPDANNAVVTIAVQTDRKILVGGYFTGIGGQKRMGIARVNAIDGSADSFNPNANWLVYSIALQADGKVLAGGFFATIDGQPRKLFARLTNDTAARQYLNVLSRTAVGWAREGSSPEVTRVTFEYSTDNVNYTLLGGGTSAGSRWVLEGLSLPTGNAYIRARGYYRTGSSNASESINESVRNAVVTAQATQATNLSTRMRIQTGDNVGIGGFIITGNTPKHVLLRAIGPSLTQFGVPNVLADPVMELHGPTGFATMTDDNWTDDSEQQALIRATGIPPTNNLESAIDTTLAPGAYTAIVRGNGNTSGLASVEVYDLDHAAASKLANISTRAFVSTGSDIVIAGFILESPGGDDRIVLRGIGPSLKALGMPNALANPTLELRDGNGALRQANDNWADDPVQAAQLTAAGLAPPSPLESAISTTLPGGLYTVLLAGKNNGAGVGLVEVYVLGAP